MATTFSSSTSGEQPDRQAHLVPPFPFLLRFLEPSSRLASGEQTGGAPTQTETGDGNDPTTTDTVEDEDVTSSWA